METAEAVKYNRKDPDRHYDGNERMHLPGRKTDFRKKDAKRNWKKVQMIFQNPKSSLNPKMTIGQNLDDALLITEIPKTERKGSVKRFWNVCTFR